MYKGEKNAVAMKFTSNNASATHSNLAFDNEVVLIFQKK